MMIIKYSCYPAEEPREKQKNYIRIIGLKNGIDVWDSGEFTRFKGDVFREFFFADSFDEIVDSEKLDDFLKMAEKIVNRKCDEVIDEVFIDFRNLNNEKICRIAIGVERFRFIM